MLAPRLFIQVDESVSCDQDVINCHVFSLHLTDVHRQADVRSLTLLLDCLLNYLEALVTWVANFTDRA